MSAIDVEGLLRELSPDAPCGPNLEYDAAYGELERAAQAKPEQQFGDTVIPGEEPDWREVKRLAVALAERTMDLRVAATLTRALIRTNGFAGLSDGLAVIRGYVERFWSTVHPHLDPEDDNDPTTRINAVSSLCDVKSLLLPLQRTPLVSSAKAGRFGLYELAIANGEIPAPPDMPSPPDQALIEAAFLDADPGQLRATHEAVTSAAAHARQIEVLVTQEVGAGRAGSLQPLTSLLSEAARALRQQLDRRGLAEPATPVAADEAPVTGTASATVAAPVRAPAADGEVRSREDVVRLLDRLCAYYEQHEPSSPVPLLLRRAKRLAAMSFLEVLRELAPDGVMQAEAIGGVNRGE